MKGFKELQERQNEVNHFVVAFVASAFMAADKFAEEMDEAVERFYLLAAHELLSSFIIRCGGQYCRHLGNNFSETSYVDTWVKNIVEKIGEFTRDNKEAEFIKAELLEQLVRQGNARVRAKYIAIPAMDKSAIPGPKRESRQVAA